MENKGFEDYLKDLNQIVEKLSSTQLPLDEAIKLYKEGSEIATSCYKLLSEKEQAVIEIMTENGLQNLEVK